MVRVGGAGGGGVDRCRGNGASAGLVPACIPVEGERMLPILPPELWLLLMQFFLRSWWKSPDVYTDA
jgi:hypothetical protein